MKLFSLFAAIIIPTSTGQYSAISKRVAPYVKCNDGVTRGIIVDIKACEQGAAQVGWSDIVMDTWGPNGDGTQGVLEWGSNYMYGCSFDSSQGLVLSINSEQKQDQQFFREYGQQSLCYTAPACTESDGNNPNTEWCTCGDITCTKIGDADGTGLYCLAVVSTCGHIPVAYYTRLNGRCPDLTNSYQITNGANCDDGSTQLGFKARLNSQDPTYGHQGGYSTTPSSSKQVDVVQITMPL